MSNCQVKRQKHDLISFFWLSYATKHAKFVKLLRKMKENIVLIVFNEYVGENSKIFFRGEGIFATLRLGIV